MATKSKKNDTCVNEVLGQVMRVKNETGKCDSADFVKATTTNLKTGEVSLYYSIRSRFVFFWGQGDTIGETLRDFMGQCEDTDCKSFIEPLIFNAYLAEMLEQEKQKLKQK